MISGLILPGGGEKGAYQAGAIRALAERGFDPHAIVGTSIGAVGGAFLAQYPMGQFLRAAADLDAKWRQVKTRDVVRHWFPPLVSAAWKGCIFNSEGYRNLIDQWIDPALVRLSGRALATVSVDWKSRCIIVGRQSDKNILEHIKASSSIPLVMEPVAVDDWLCTDGGVRDVAPIAQAMHLGVTDAVVVSCTNPDLLDSWEPDTGMSRFTSFAARTMDMVLGEMTESDWRECGLKNELAETKNKYKFVRLTVIRPSKPLNTGLLKFSRKQAEQLSLLGYEDCIRTLDAAKIDSWETNDGPMGVVWATGESMFRST
jgi:NTE family protein